MTPTHHRDWEQPIGVLIPKPLADRPRPRPAPILGLPVPRPPVDLSAVELVLGVACPDRSGRVTVSAGLQALDWGPGQPRSSPHGDQAYGSVISRRQSPQGRVPGWVADCPYAVAVAQGQAGRTAVDRRHRQLWLASVIAVAGLPLAIAAIGIYVADGPPPGDRAVAAGRTWEDAPARAAV